MSTTNQSLIRIATFSAYDLQLLRLQMGARLVANFRSKLGLTTKPGETAAGLNALSTHGTVTTDNPDPITDLALRDDDEEKAKEQEDAEKVLTMLRDSYKLLTTGVARNRTIPQENKFKGDQLITDYAELVLVDSYLQIENRERAAFRGLESILNKLPVYTTFLKNQIGIGPAMAAVLVAYLDPHKAHRISGFWSYCGVDVGPDGRGRSRRAEHLIDREYVKRDGSIGIKKSVTFNPWLKSRLLGVLCTSFLRLGSGRRRTYDGYKHRINTDPGRIKVTSVMFIKAYKAIKEDGYWENPQTHEHISDPTRLWTPKRVHAASMRYMLKMFLVDLWTVWRGLEGLEITPTYAEAKLGLKHGQSAA